jgi:hypothetical protein
MESIMKFLGHLEELLAALNNVPASIHPQLPQKGHHAAQDLSHATTAEGGVYVLDYPP